MIRFSILTGKKRTGNYGVDWNSTTTVAESESLSKTIRVEIIFGASSTKYNLLFLKKYPIKYAELRLTEA